MNPLHAYLSKPHAIHAGGAGVKEASSYPAVSGLFNSAGKTLKPSTRCIINLKNTGGGIPNSGFFTPDEAREVTAMARRITSLLRSGPALDASQQAVKASAWAWQERPPA